MSKLAFDRSSKLQQLPRDRSVQLRSRAGLESPGRFIALAISIPSGRRKACIGKPPIQNRTSRGESSVMAAIIGSPFTVSPIANDWMKPVAVIGWISVAFSRLGGNGGERGA